MEDKSKETNVEQRKLSEVLAQFDLYCLPRRNLAMESFKFYTLSQKEKQPFSDFETALRTQMQHCKFECIKCNESFGDRMLRDRIIIGVADKKLQMKLLEGKDAKLSEVVDTCKIFEAASESKRLKIESVDQDSRAGWFKTFEINGLRIKFKLDSGADISTIPINFFVLNCTDYSANKVKIYGSLKLDLIDVDSGKTQSAIFFVVDEEREPLLGRMECEAFNLLVRGRLSSKRRKQKHYFDRNSKPLHPLDDNEKIMFKKTGKEWHYGKVFSRVNGRSYIVVDGFGNQFRRNRKHLVRTKNQSVDSSELLCESFAGATNVGDESDLNENDDSDVADISDGIIYVDADQSINNENNFLIDQPETESCALDYADFE
ncbi:hypothetical protein Bhyg_07672 [Pseudolycoriella hygida]|uniref:Peptidase A2 domain-containing protein n=1 Tax=Pseudolycoriella hygida TaxID=35572 RepID=A0A9Q0S3K6_9DIPT|nr:hypothetical protein Bhyg_07672 [Pseudolycoriella hygida]